MSTVMLLSSSTATKKRSGRQFTRRWSARVPVVCIPLWCNRQKWMLQMNYLPSGLNGLSLTPCERHLADVARIVAGRAGTCYITALVTRGKILTEGVLRFPTIGLEAVSLSRLPEVAIYSAVLPREDTFDSPSILVLDRETLQEPIPS